MIDYDEAIERLKAINAECKSIYSVVDAFMGKEIACAMDAITFRDALVELLQHADPSKMTDSELDEYGLMHEPQDADGKVIRLGDMVRYKNGSKNVYRVKYLRRQEGDWGLHWLIGVSDEDGNNCWGGFQTDFTHHHEPTVGEILDELEGMRGTGDYEAVVTRCAELAERLRELLKEDES